MIIPNIRKQMFQTTNQYKVSPLSVVYHHFWHHNGCIFRGPSRVSKKLPQEHTVFGSHIKWQGEGLGSFRMWAMRNIVILGKPQRSCWHQIQELDCCKTDDSESLNTMHIRTNDHRNCLPQWIWFPRCDSNFAWTLRVWSFVSWLAGKAISF